MAYDEEGLYEGPIFYFDREEVELFAATGIYG